MKSRDLFKNQLDKNNADIGRKNKELIDKIQDLDQVKRKYEEAISNVEPGSLSNSRVNYLIYI